MVKIFKRNGKLNFVDDRNIVVGFDYISRCCECFSYKLAYEDNIQVDESYIEGEDYRIDTGYLKVLDKKEAEELLGVSLDCGGAVQFMLVHDCLPTVYVTLFNAHDGYYHHGFEFKSGETVLRARPI